MTEETEEQQSVTEVPAEALEFFRSGYERPRKSGRIIRPGMGVNSVGRYARCLPSMKFRTRSIDLDSVAYQENNKGGRDQKSDRATAHWAEDNPTRSMLVPNTCRWCVGNIRCVSGMAAWQKMLEENNVSWNRSVDTDPYSFLPGWLHKR